MAVNHGTSSMQIRVTGAFIRPIKSPIKPSSVREDGLLPLDPPLWVAQPPTEDKSSTRIPPRGCREFSLPDSYPETQRNRSTYCLELIFAHPPLFSHLSSFVETSTLIPANFLLTFHFLFFFFFFLLFLFPFLFLFRSRSVYFRSRRVHALSKHLVFGKEKREEDGFSWWPGDEWWREFGKRGQVRPGLINEVDRIACQEIRFGRG